MAEAQRKGYDVNFDVLHYAKSKGKFQQLNEIGEQEGYYIRKYRPVLNSQIPDESDWKKFSVNNSAMKITFKELEEMIL